MSEEQENIIAGTLADSSDPEKTISDTEETPMLFLPPLLLDLHQQ